MAANWRWPISFLLLTIVITTRLFLMWTMEPAGIRQIPGPVVPYQSAFSDAHWHVEDMLAEGDTVITRWSGTGTQDGDLPGSQPPDGRCLCPACGCNGLWTAGLWKAGKSGILWRCCSNWG
jgi:hypothetical protein